MLKALKQLGFYSARAKRPATANSTHAIVVKHSENKAFESQYSSPLLRDRGSENSDSYKKPELGLAQ
ncbi:hypothetical protein [Nostoc sp.]|uniref:hypothetical protein n=1 Tax=Nostoc sp. TaxID=1180 RepID=UPI002FF61FB4